MLEVAGTTNMMGPAPFWVCITMLVLIDSNRPAEAGSKFLSYKVCHGEKQSVCEMHPEFDHYEGCANSENGDEGEAKAEHSCKLICGAGLCAVAPPRYELDVGDKCRYSWF